MRVSRFWVLSLPALPALSAYLFLHFIWWCKNPLHLTAHTKDYKQHGRRLCGGSTVRHWVQYQRLSHCWHENYRVESAVPCGTYYSYGKWNHDIQFSMPMKRLWLGSKSECLINNCTLCNVSEELYELDPNMIWHPVRLVGLVRV